MVLAPIYVAQIADVNIRGIFTTLVELGYSVGALFVFALSIGGYLHWLTITWICLCFSSIHNLSSVSVIVAPIRNVVFQSYTACVCFGSRNLQSSWLKLAKMRKPGKLWSDYKVLTWNWKTWKPKSYQRLKTTQMNRCWVYWRNRSTGNHFS